MKYSGSFNRFILTSLALLGLSVSTLNNSVYAAPVTFDFSGRITEVDFGSFTPTEFAAGDSFSGSYTFDSASTDFNSDSNSGSYYNAISNFSINAGTYSGSATDGDILVGNNLPSDNYEVIGLSGTGPDVLNPGIDIFEIDIFGFVILDGSGGDEITSDALLLTPPDVSKFNSIFAYLEFAGNLNDGFVDAVIDSITLSTDVSTVPAPAAIWLFGPALVGLACFNKRTRKARIKSLITT